MSDINDLLESKPVKKESKPPVAPKMNQTSATQSSGTPNNLDDLEITYSPSRMNNYKTLKSVGKFLKFIAYGAGGLSCLIMFISLIYLIDDNSEAWISMLAGFSGILIALPFAFLSESINVMLDIEANTRQAAKTLGRILKSQ